MTTEELYDKLKLIQKMKCETQNLELKSAEQGYPKRLYDSLSSFSNQDDGGIIVFGIDEKQDYKEVGVYDAQDVQKKINEQLGKIQPDTRNPVLASALETLGIIENRYSGIPTIRMEMEKYNLRQPEFLDERGSFIVKLYKESKNDYEDMSNDEETNNLIVFCKTPRTRKEICDYLGLNSVTYAIQTYVNPLVEAGVIKLSIPDKPKSPKQLYYSGEREK